MNLKQYFQRFQIIKGARYRDCKKVFLLFKLFDRADRETKRLSAKTGIKCAKGCGRCCENPYVETTILEMLPLAIQLWKEKEAEGWLNKSLATHLTGPCIFYKPDPLIAGKGRCSIYSLRPLICRLSGFSAAVDKHGKPELVTCPTIKQWQPREYEKAQKLVESGLPIPQLRDFALAAYQLDPALGKDRLPINIAIKDALEKVGLYFYYQKESPKGISPASELKS